VLACACAHYVNSLWGLCQCLILLASSSFIENNCVECQIIMTLSPCDCMTLESIDRFVIVLISLCSSTDLHRNLQWHLKLNLLWTRCPYIIRNLSSYTRCSPTPAAKQQPISAAAAHFTSNHVTLTIFITVWPWPWPFDLQVNAWWATAMKYMCAKFVVDSSSRFPIRMWTHTHTVTDTTDHPIPCIGYCWHEIRNRL